MKRVRNHSIGILIQDADTKKFYKQKNKWVAVRDQAMSFESCADAVSKIRKENLNADLVLTFGDTIYDVKIPWR